jgi:hypothetical protein
LTLFYRAAGPRINRRAAAIAHDEPPTELIPDLRALSAADHRSTSP